MTVKVDSSKTAIFTIVSNNYLHFARTLMESVRTHEPECDRYVMVLDDPVADEARADADLYEVVTLEQFELPEPKKFLFRYNVLEANTAVKPWVIGRLSAELGYGAVIYLDPDILLYRPLTHVHSLLDQGASLVLTPHLMGPVWDDKRPSEIDILQAGAYNLGFAAVGAWSRSRDLIKWWQQRLERHCVVDPANGLFVDQKWMDLALGLFPDVAVLRHKGYNVAYWNLHERPVRKTRDGWTADDEPLHFFHFSGLEIDQPDRFSKHQTRYRLDDTGDAQILVRDYCRQLASNGAEHFRKLAYGFGRHSLDYQIPDIVRRLHRSNPDVEEAWGDDPFTRNLTPVLNAFAEYDHTRPRLTRLMRWIWRDRSELQAAFPDPEFADRARYVAWFERNAKNQFRLDDRWIEPAKRELKGLAQGKGATPAPNMVAEVIGLFSQHGEAFVRRAYQLILGRAPDPDGLGTFLSRLESGKRSRRWVVWALLLSREGRRRRRSLGQMAALSLPLVLIKPFARGIASHSVPAKAEPDAPIARAGGRSRPSGINRKPRLWAQSSQSAPDSIRVVGYFEMATGVAESARRCVASAAAAGYTVECWTAGLGGEIERQNRSKNTGNASPVTIAHINADQLCVMGQKLDCADGGNSYRIGYWHWELPEFPPKYYRAFEFVDEVWVPSKHMLDALTRVSPVPVVKIPHSIEVPDVGPVKRADFGIPEDAFAFHCMYDLCSYQERKNPMGAVRAYLQAFPDPSPNHCLVIKANNSGFDKCAYESLLEVTRDRGDILILEQAMDRHDVFRLESTIDCFVSLHRAEGFGLCAAECMYLGKPVIATGWSGNMEFMTTQNSYLVDYQLCHLAQPVGPYEAGQVWAEPDIEQAARLMKEVYVDDRGRNHKSKQAMKSIRESLSPAVIGKQYSQRIESILHFSGI